MALSESQLAFCVEWCEKHVTTWQVFRKGDWKYKWHGKTLVRYVDSVRVCTDEMSALLEYLTTDACVATLALNKQGISGEWKPVNAWYEVNQKPNGAIGGVRLYHALMIHPEDGTGDGPYVVENGCMWKVSWTFYWKQQTVVAVPASSSGVNYRITNLNRDDENGTFNYVMEKRERVRQDISEYVTAKTSFETQKEEQHLGVKQSSVSSAGKSASVSNGKLVRRKLRKNEDCTTDVINETTEEVAVSGAVTETSVRLRGTETTTVNRNMANKANEKNLSVGSSVRNEKTEGGRWTQTIRKFAASVAGKLRTVCRKTVFRHTQAETTNVAKDPGFQHVKDAGGGVIRETDVQKTEYDTFDVTDTVTTDIPAPGAVTETRKFIDGTVTRTVNRNQTEKASEAGLDVGDSVRNEKTESGLWDQTIERASAEPAGRVGEACEQNALAHTHSTTDGNGKNPPTSMDVKEQTGSVVSRRARKTERGAWEVTDETRTAKPVTKTVRGGSASRTTETTVYRNAEIIPSGTGGKNKEVDASVSPNEFGLVDGTVRTTTYSPTAANANGGAVNASVAIVAKRNATDTPNEGPAQNKTVDVSISPNDHGSFDWTQRTTTYTEKSATGGGGTDGTTVTTETHRDAPNAPQAEQGEVNKVVDVSVTPNDHGSYDYTKRTTTYSEKTATGGGGTDGTTVTTETHRNSPQQPQSEAGAVNKVVETSVTPNDHGSFDWTKRTTKYSEKQATGGGGTDGTTVTTETHRDAPNAPQAEQGGVNKVVETSVTPNDHGSFDWTKRTTEYNEKAATATGGSYMTRETRTVTENTTDGQPNENPNRGTTWDVTSQPNDHGSFRVTKTRRTAKADQQNTSWEDTVETADTITKYNCAVFVYRNQPSVPQTPKFQSIQCSLSINDFGLYDVIYHCRSFVRSDKKNGDGNNGTTGSKSRTIKRYKEAVVDRDGKPTGAHKTVRATEVIYWSTDPMVSLRHWNNSDKGYGFKPILFRWGNLYCSVCYKNINGDMPWEFGREIQSGG